MIYRNIKTGAIIDVASVVNGKNWILIPESAEEKPKKNSKKKQPKKVAKKKNPPKKVEDDE